VAENFLVDLQANLFAQEWQHCGCPFANSDVIIFIFGKKIKVRWFYGWVAR
jgi:hypothetical protein